VTETLRQTSEMTQPDYSQAPFRNRNIAQALLPITGVANIAKGIAGVMSEVGTIKKGGYNNFHHYHYARLEDLLEALTPLMGKHGIVLIQNEVERNIVENRILVTYEFSIIHTSGEMWPERPRFTGMSMGRDSKGNWDDKAINKCHSAARKYFLLSLFQVPSGDFDDSDGDRLGRASRPTVPGPTQVRELEKAVDEKERLEKERLPHKIALGPGAGADQWASAYIRGIERTKNEAELKLWDTLNNDTLQKLSDEYPSIYDQIDVAVRRRLELVAPVPVPAPSPSEIISAMPDPAKDTQEAMNWIAQKLNDMRTYEAAEQFWNKFVAPQENYFDETDWGLLIKEWNRTEMRLAPPQDDPPEAA
jgi:hypothetical protein